MGDEQCGSKCGRCVGIINRNWESAGCSLFEICGPYRITSCTPWSRLGAIQTSLQAVAKNGVMLYRGRPESSAVVVMRSEISLSATREIVRVKNEDGGEWEERWVGDYIFHDEWQSFRTKKGCSMELRSVFHECTPGLRKLAIKMVDILATTP